MRIFVLARTQHEITQHIYPALAREARASIVGYDTSTENLAAQLQATQPDAILVKMTLSRRGEEQALLERLATHGLPLLVVLPHGRKALAGSLRTLPYVTAVEVEPVNYTTLPQEPAAPPAQAPPAKTAAAPPPLADGSTELAEVSPTRALAHSPTRSLADSPPRLIAFTSGLMGGTGKSTLAGTLAWMLAHESRARVLLLALGNPAAVVTHFKLARWPHVGLFLEGEEPFDRVLQSSDSLAVAIAPGDLGLYDEIGTRTHDAPGAVMRVVEQAAAHFDLVIADLPPDVSGWAIHPLLAAHNMDTVVVARPTVADQAGLVQAMTLVESLRWGTMPHLYLVLNDRQERDLAPKAFVAGVEQMLACPSLVATIPHNDVVRPAQNEGVPLPLARGAEGVVKELRWLGIALGLEIEMERERKIETEREREIERGDGAVSPRRGKKRAGFSFPGIQIKLTD